VAAVERKLRDCAQACPLFRVEVRERTPDPPLCTAARWELTSGGKEPAGNEQRGSGGLRSVRMVFEA